MRRLGKGLIILAVLLALLWGGVWFALAEVAKRQTQAWFQMQTLTGRMAGYDALRVTGFPLAFRMELDAPYLADPFRARSWTAPVAQIAVQSLPPLRVSLPLADRHTLLLPGPEVVEITGTDMRGDLRLTGFDLTLDTATAQGAALRVAARSGWTVTLDDVDLALTALPDDPKHLSLVFEAAGLRPDAAVLTALGLGGDGTATPALDSAQVAARLAFDAAPSVLGAGPPMLREIALDDLRLIWGTAELSASGTLAITATGQPEGVLEFQLRDWRKILGAAVSLGLMHPDAAVTWENALGNMQAADPDAPLEIRLSFRDGRTRLGPLPIGPAPVLWPPAP